jgi:hypothetical protein
LHRAHRFARWPGAWIVVPSLIYRWREELRTATAGFTEVVVTAGPEERAVTGPALEIEFGRDIRADIVAKVFLDG